MVSAGCALICVPFVFWLKNKHAREEEAEAVAAAKWVPVADLSALRS